MSEAESEVSQEVTEQLMRVGELVLKFYQYQFNEIAVETRSKDVTLVVTDRYDFAGESILISLRELEDDRVSLSEGKEYLRAFVVAAEGIMTAEETVMWISAIAAEWDVVAGITGDRFRSGIVETKDNFVDAYGRYLDFLSEVTCATAFCEQIIAIRAGDVEN